MDVLRKIYRTIRTIFIVTAILLYIIISSLYKEYGVIMASVFLFLIIATFRNLFKREWGLALICFLSILGWREFYQPSYPSDFIPAVDEAVVVYRARNDTLLYNPELYYTDSNPLLIVLGIAKWRKIEEINGIEIRNIEYMEGAILKIKGSNETRRTNLELFSRRMKIIGENEEEKVVTIPGIDLMGIVFFNYEE